MLRPVVPFVVSLLLVAVIAIVDASRFMEGESELHLDSNASAKNHSGYRCSGHSASFGTIITPVMLPFIDESTWSIPLRAFLYLLALFYLFVGVSIGVDVFMSAIEKITSHKVKVKDKKLGPNGETVYKSVNFWNPTVATLTLGAAGTCSPEILLTTIEVLSANFAQTRNLGPGTIIGSAAFNLLVSTAICVVSVPSPQTRSVAHLPVYITTSIFRLFAYLWLLVVLGGFSSDEIEIWEAAVTFMFFPILVVTAYLADRRVCCRKRVSATNTEETQISLPSLHGLSNGAAYVENGFAGSHELHDLQNANGVGANGFVPLDAPSTSESSSNNGLIPDAKPIEEIDREAALMLRKADPKEVAEWKARQIEAQKLSNFSHIRSHWIHRVTSANVRFYAALMQSAHQDEEVALIEFAAKHYAVRSDDKKIRLKILRKGNVKCRCEIRYETMDGTATVAGADYVSVARNVVFEAGEIEKLVDVQILNGKEPEPDETFYVKLLLTDPATAEGIRIGEINPAEITIIGNVDASTIQFKDRRLIVKESAGYARVKLERRGAPLEPASGTISTVDAEAKAGIDYVELKKEVRFESGETEKVVEVEIHDTAQLDKNVSFRVNLTNVGGAATLGDRRSMLVSITSDDEFAAKLAEANRLCKSLLEEEEHLPWRQAWRKQFVAAMNVNDGDLVGATAADYCLHWLTFFWKVLFAFVPPPALLGGYVTFFTALAVLALLIALVDDVCQIFGCLLNLNSVLIGAMFVSVGTNLPDLFASKIAAVQEKTADNAMVHINGSICTNVFLGLGVPWLMCSVYQRMNGEKFTVDTEDLYWCVVIYIGLSVACTTMFILRRNLSIFGKAEFGGPVVPKFVCFVILILCWVLYIALTGLQSEKIILGIPKR